MSAPAATPGTDPLANITFLTICKIILKYVNIRYADAKSGGAVMTEQPEESRRARGRVKWFDRSRGYGFIVLEEGGPDVLLHANALRAAGLACVSENTEIDVLLQQGLRGLQAVEVLALAPGADPAAAPVAVPLREDLPLEPARVKWFDKARGFGFCNVFGCPHDIFVHAEVLRRCGFSELLAGEAVALQIVEGERGRMAVIVVPWDRGAQQQ